MANSNLKRSTVAIIHISLICSSALMLLPFAWMFSLSMKSPEEAFQSTFNFIPHSFYGFENYARALTEAPLVRYIENGIFVCSSILFLQIMISAPCGYALAKINFRGKKACFILVLISLLIPHQALLMPLFFLCHWLGILNTYLALILPFIVSPFGIFLFRQFFKTVPNDIIDAARLDGISELGIVWKVIMPMSLPAVLTFSIFSVVGHWNDLFWPLIAVRDQSLMPPSLGVLHFRSEEAGNEYGPLMAASTLVVAPLVVIFVVAQRWFIDGLTSGATK